MPALTYSEIEAAMPATALTTVQGLPYRKIASGKVRELFDTGEHLLMIATDRISAFDVVMPNGVPGKGIILTQIARHWFEQSRDLVPNHLLDDHDAALAAVLGEQRDLAPRSMLVRKLKPCRSRPSCAATSRAAVGRNTARRAPSGASRCRPSCAKARRCRGPISRPRARPMSAMTSR
jgi:hypothetical protein